MSDSTTLNETYQNILSRDVSIVGSIKFGNDLVVDGSIEGEVISEGNLTIGDNARIKGEIKTRSVIVYGTVEGNITVNERCILKSTADVEGDIAAGTISIEEGACFAGRSSVGAKPKAS